MTSIAALLQLNKKVLSERKTPLQPLLLSIALWSGFLIASVYSLIAYYDMNHAKVHANYVVQLNNAAQQLRQTVSASMLNQSNQLVPLEKEVQHFRYLLLRTKSNTIEDNWEDLQRTLLDADAFVEDVDNLLASIYAVSSVTRQIKQLMDKETSPELQQRLQAVSSYLLFELHGLNDKSNQTRIERFNGYIGELEREMSDVPNGLKRTQLFNLYTGLERLNRQLESVDAVTNHKFVRSMTQLQKYWTTRVLQLLDQTLIGLAMAFACLFGLVFVRAKVELPVSGQVHSQIADSVPEQVAANIKPVFVPPTEPLFEPGVLQEQLENDEEAIESVLTMFVAEHQSDGKALRKHIEEKEAARARTLVHNLKGVSGNIGALALQQHCTEADARLRAGELIDISDVDNFEKLLTLTIQAVLKEMEKPHKTTAS
ncbi:Hpt domain-containing protein [Enterovibrio paralichthyis]|uniref:Hpt domain-containing protein n=1 Tax=Enterovibrio paralichthyis TaxID=2853805 RepID=UPI001C437A67|nr:Hpt domain-containing protein [Enterovibrio paralichthyis]